MTELATVRIGGIAAGGSGVARTDGFVVFVPRTAPGDVAQVSFTRRGRFGDGRLVQLLQPAPERIEPSCVHYERDRCGGCQLQHLSYPAQLAAKGRIVADALSRIAHRPVDVQPVVASPSEWAYRNKLTLAMRRSGATWTIGLHSWDDVDRVFSLRECPITDPRVVAGWHALFACAKLLPRASELRGSVRLAGDGLGLLIEGGRTWPAANAFADCCPSFDSVRWRPEGGGGVRVLVDRGSGPGPGASFAQVNPLVASELHARVVLRVRELAPGHVVDAYAGTGATTIPLAAAGIRVTAIELDRESSARTARAIDRPSRAVAGRVEDKLASAFPADVVILNPPRGGVDAAVCATFEHARPRARTIIYVSCNPATLARDVARLPSYRITRVQPFDMFPQTAHVETVCELFLEDA